MELSKSSFHFSFCRRRGDESSRGLKVGLVLSTAVSNVMGLKHEEDAAICKNRCFANRSSKALPFRLTCQPPSTAASAAFRRFLRRCCCCCCCGDAIEYGGGVKEEEVWKSLSEKQDVVEVVVVVVVVTINDVVSSTPPQGESTVIAKVGATSHGNNSEGWSFRRFHQDCCFLDWMREFRCSSFAKYRSLCSFKRSCILLAKQFPMVVLTLDSLTRRVVGWNRKSLLFALAIFDPRRKQESSPFLSFSRKSVRRDCVFKLNWHMKRKFFPGTEDRCSNSIIHRPLLHTSYNKGDFQWNGDGFIRFGSLLLSTLSSSAMCSHMNTLSLSFCGVKIKILISKRTARADGFQTVVGHD